MLDANRPIVELENIRVDYPGGVRAIDEVNLRIFEKDLIGLIGPNGAGKSTLLGVILGLIKPSYGSVRLFGEAIKPNNLRFIGYVPQKAQVIDSNFPARVDETVLLGRVPGAGLFHRLTKEDRVKAEEAMKILGIDDLRERRIGQLSGGQSQRVFIAKAIIDRPRLLILDEPTTGVDAQSKSEFYNTLSRLNQEFGITILLSSHDIGIVTKLANKIACINRTLYFCGPTSEFETSSALSKLYDYPAGLMIHDHP
jgi:zinc transport system ATP-binding protein